MTDHDEIHHTPGDQQIVGVAAVITQLHRQCSKTVLLSLQGENTVSLGEIYRFVGDLEAWQTAIEGRLETTLVGSAASEYVSAVLSVCQGQYRSGFKGLRLVLELCLQSTHLSANLVLRAQWLKGEKDTLWATLVDAENGPLSAHSTRAFFPELLDHVANFRELAKTLYRELSECIHGNVPNHIPLPEGLRFSQLTFDLWREKAKTVRFVVHFALALRYLSELPVGMRSPLQDALIDELGHIAAIRAAFEQGT